MSERKHYMITLGAGLGCAAIAGGLIWWQSNKIDAAKDEVATLRQSITTSRQLLTGTNVLEREVLILRETEAAIKEILPDEEGVNALVKQLRDFETESEVRITGLNPKANPNGPQNRNQFDKVAYTITLEADVFQLLDFMDRIESHSRFMAIRDFKLTSATRKSVEDTGYARHRVSMDVETYVYEPQDVSNSVKIEGYDRKRELLLGEISRRRQALKLDQFDYHGPRGRRDPWVDPRVPVNMGVENGLTIEQQLELVEDFVDRIHAADALWLDVQAAENVIHEMTKRAELEEMLIAIDEDLRRTEEDGAIRFGPSLRRMERDVHAPLAQLREGLAETEGNRGPSLEVMDELLATMTNHLTLGEFALAHDAFDTIEPRLALAEVDPERRALVARLRDLADRAQAAIEFQEMSLDVGGYVIGEDLRPYVLIDGTPYTEGDFIDNREDLMIRSIQEEQIEFVYRGVILIRNH